VLSGVERNLQTQILTAALVPEPDLPKALASQMDRLDLRLLYPCLVKGAEAFLRMEDSKMEAVSLVAHSREVDAPMEDMAIIESTKVEERKEKERQKVKKAAARPGPSTSSLRTAEYNDEMALLCAMGFVSLGKPSLKSDTPKRCECA
jgi:hypothetical protein